MVPGTGSWLKQRFIYRYIAGSRLHTGSLPVPESKSCAKLQVTAGITGTAGRGGWKQSPLVIGTRYNVARMLVMPIIVIIKYARSGCPIRRYSASVRGPPSRYQNQVAYYATRKCNRLLRYQIPVPGIVRTWYQVIRAVQIKNEFSYVMMAINNFNQQQQASGLYGLQSTTIYN